MKSIATGRCRTLLTRFVLGRVSGAQHLAAESSGNRTERDDWRDSDVRETEWRRWNTLDTQDERERLSFSLFVGQLEQKFDQHEEEDTNDADDALAPIFIDRPHRSPITFPEEIKIDCVAKLLQDLVVGKQLSLQCIQNILDLAMPILKESPNVVTLPKPEGAQRVLVVGDLHGSLADLHHIFEQNGWPSEENVYIFNGDFVDRGLFGLEVLMVLLACKVALPGSVLLNRGNHEDRLLCTAYGFHSEVLQKANKRVFSTVCQIFALLPLLTVIEETALVVHGGLPGIGAPERLLEDVAAISRSDWQTMQRVELANLSEEDRLQLRMMKDLLWSDPDPTVQGIKASPRGAGCLFGNDVVFKYLCALGLPHLVRSHQCVLKGFETTTLPNNYEHHTVFSASNYCGSQNLAAVLIFNATQKEERVNRNFVSWVPPVLSNLTIAEKSHKVIDDTIRKIKMALESSYASSGTSINLDKDQCNEIVEKALGVPMPWKDIVEISTMGELSEKAVVNFPDFLDNYEDYVRSRGQLSFEGAHMYKKLKLLQAVFAYFDMDNDGVISKKEWMHGCDLLNAEVEEHMKVDGSRFFEILDMDKTGIISLNELCEGFRISRLRISGDDSEETTTNSYKEW